MNAFTSLLYQNKIAGYIFWIVCALLLYGNTLQHGFVLDDDLVIGINKHVQLGLEGIPEMFAHSHTHGATGQDDLSYRPLPLVLFALVQDLFGGSTFVYHLLNVLFYGIAVALLFQLLLINSNRIAPRLALLITALYCVHPLHTEVVANIKSLEDILQFALAMGTLVLLHRFFDQKNRAYLAAALGTFFLALLSKEIAATLLVIIPLYLWVMRSESIQRIALITGAFLAVFAAYWIMRSTATGDAEIGALTLSNNALMATENGMDRFATALWIQVKYLGLFLFPQTLSYDYSFNQIPIVAFGSLKFILALVIGVALIGMAALGVWKKRVEGFGIAFYLLAMVLVSNLFFLIGSTMGERFTFTASAGLCIALIHGIDTRLKAGQKRLLVYGMLPVILLMAFKTFERNKDWKSNELLFTADLKTAPNSTRVQLSMGNIYRGKAERASSAAAGIGFLRKAKTHYLKSAEILPSNPDAWYNLGVIENRMGNPTVAIEAYEKCIEHAPEYAVAYNNIGVIYFNQQQQEKAMEYFEKAYSLQPNTPDILANMGLKHHYRKDYERAIEYYERTLEIAPSHKGAQVNLARARNMLNKP